MLSVVIAYVIAVLRFEVSDVYAIVVVLEDILDIKSEGDQLVGTVPVCLSDDFQKRLDRVDDLIGVCILGQNVSDGVLCLVSEAGYRRYSRAQKHLREKTV